MEEDKQDIFNLRNTQFKTGLDTDARKNKAERKQNELRRNAREVEASKKRGMKNQETSQQWIKLDDHFKKVYKEEDLPNLLALA